MNKRITPVFLFQLLFFAAFCQKKDHVFNINNPPNTAYLFENIFIDSTEIANLHYLEYLYWIRQDSTEDFYLSQLPVNYFIYADYQPKDSLDSIRHQYLYHSHFRFYPVVGVSYEQAENYCAWRSGFINSRLENTAYKSRSTTNKKLKIKFTYRLPTVEEWEYAAAGGLNPNSFPYGMVRPLLKNEQYTFEIKKDPYGWCRQCLEMQSIQYQEKDQIHKVEFNVKEEFYFGLQELISCDSIKNFGTDLINKHPSNSYGLLNMIGNVAEMTLTEGIAKGGSFLHSLDQISLKTNFSYTKPELWLGFRCICEAEVSIEKN